MYTEKYLPNGKYNMDNAERYEMTPPQSILEFAELKDGMTVCDIGCGTGFYTETAAKMNPNGKIYALEVSQDNLDSCRARCEKLGLTNVEYRIIAVDSPLFAEGIADLVLFCIVCHETKDRPKYMKRVKGLLKPGGRILFIEWLNPPGLTPPPADRVVPKELAHSIVAEAGLRVIKEQDCGDFYIWLLEQE